MFQKCQKTPVFSLVLVNFDFSILHKKDKIFNFPYDMDIFLEKKKSLTSLFEVPVYLATLPFKNRIEAT